MTTSSIIGSGHMDQAIASHLPTLQQPAREVVPALREPSAAARDRSRMGQRP